MSKQCSSLKSIMPKALGGKSIINKLVCSKIVYATQCKSHMIHDKCKGLVEIRS